MTINAQAVENMEKLRQIKIQMHTGLITYDEAQRLAEPIIAEINENSKAVAKRLGGKYTALTFRKAMR